MGEARGVPRAVDEFRDAVHPMAFDATDTLDFPAAWLERSASEHPDRIAGVAQLDEVDALHCPAVMNIQARYDPFSEHNVLAAP